MDDHDHLNLHTDSDDSDLIVEKVIVVKKQTSVTKTSKLHISAASTTTASGYNSKQIKPINFLTNGNGIESDEDELPDIPEENYYCFTQQQSPPKKFKTSMFDSSAAGAGSTAITQKPRFPQAQSTKTKANHINRVLDSEDDLLDLDFGNYSSKITTNTSSKAVGTNVGKSSSSTSTSSKNSGTSSSSSYKNLMEAISKSSSSSSTSKDECNVERIGTTKPTTSKSQSQRTKPVKGTLSSVSSVSGPSSTATESQKRKEKEKEDKERGKELKRLEREQKKQELEKEKELKKVENELRRNTKPGEAEKFVAMQLDESLPHKDELIAFFLEREFTYEIVSNPLYEKSITFRRETKYQAMGDDMKLQLMSRFEDEADVLLYLNHEDIVPKVYQEIHNDPSEDDITLTNYIQSIQSLNSSKKITLLIYGMENYFKKIKKSSQQEFRDRVLNGEQEKRQRRKKNQLPSISPLEFQSVMIEVQLTTKINYRLVGRVKELGILITQYLKAIAVAPFKRLQKEQGFEWFASADSAGSVKIEKDGKGLATLWLEQIQLFGKVGVDTAQAVVRHYPTPYHLYRAYKSCQSVDDGLNLLRDITVRSGIGPLARTRRVGPEISKKIYRFFTSTDPDRCLGSQRDF